MNLKGSLPLLILQFLDSRPGHGYEINKFIDETSGGILSFKEGTLYPTLHKLEGQGYIEGYDGKMGGRKRRYYRLTEAGKEELKQSRAEWSKFVQAVNHVLDTIPKNTDY